MPQTEIQNKCTTYSHLVASDVETLKGDMKVHSSTAASAAASCSLCAFKSSHLKNNGPPAVFHFGVSYWIL